MTADAVLLRDDLKSQMEDLGRAAHRAAAVLSHSAPETKNQGLRAAAAALRKNQDGLLAANAQDMADGRAKGLTAALLDRLELNPGRIEAMAVGLEDIAAFPDPIGKVLSEWERPNGLKIARVSVPLGVIGIIYESRPNVTADAGGLCLKSGNAAILRGGSESARSSAAILECLQSGLAEAGLPPEALQRPPTSDRAAVGLLLTMSDWVDVIVPRGGRGLIERVREESRIPVMSHLDGLCHTYIHAAAEPDKARAIVVNAKMRRPGICGATETLLIDQAVAADQLPAILAELAAAGCALRGDGTSQTIGRDAGLEIDAAQPEDWDTEYLAPILSVRVVDGLEEAVAHINRHGSHHTEAIVTEDQTAADRFMQQVDAGIS